MLSRLIVSLGLAAALIPAAAAAASRPVVVELFTSQGCSSCPPANAYLNELAKDRRDVLPLAFHVTYWDRLGWKDPFSLHQATERQERYRRLLGLATIYTPQIVVAGHWQAIGSERDAVERALHQAQGDHPALPVTIAIADGRARVSIGPGTERAFGSVFLVAYDRRHDTAVARGENAGRRATDVDAVRGIAEIGRIDGRDSTIETAIPWPGDRVAAIVAAEDGRILGVAGTN